MKHDDNEIFISNKELIKDAENILFVLAHQISRGNLKNKSTYETLLFHFANADLNRNYLGQLNLIITSFKKEVKYESH